MLTREIIQYVILELYDNMYASFEYFVSFMLSLL